MRREFGSHAESVRYKELVASRYLQQGNRIETAGVVVGEKKI